jgi:hypothetical protein
MPNIITWILRFFKKPEKSVIKENINLDKWEKLRKLPDPYIGDIFLNCKNMEEIAMALAYSDEKTIKRFLMAAEGYGKSEKLKLLIKEYSDTSKNMSDKMKAHISNYSGIGRPGYAQITLKD